MAPLASLLQRSAPLGRLVAPGPWTPHAAVRIAAATAAALVAIGVLVAGSSESVGLALLSILAVSGLFFLYGTLAGYVRIDLDAPDSDVETRVARYAGPALEVTRADGTLVYANRAASDLRGTRFGTIETMLSAEPMAGESAYRLASAAARGETAETDIQIATSDLWLRVGVKPFTPPLTAAVDAPMALWSVTDVTAEHRRAAEAAAAQARLIAEQDALPVGLFTTDAGGGVGQMNATLRRLLSITGQDARALDDLTTPDGASRLRAVLATSARAALTRVDLDLVADDGRMIPAIVLVGAGRQLLVFAREAFPAPSASVGGDRFQRVFDSAPFGVATIDHDGRVVASNAAFTRLVPDAAGPAQGIVQRLAGGAPADQKAAVETAIVRALDGRLAGAPVDVAIAGETPCVRRVTVHPLTVGLDANEAAIVYVTDASEQKALEQRYAQSEKMEAIGTFVAGIAHDFNNVLGAIIGSSEHLLQLRRENDRGHSEALQIRATALRAAEMVKQLMAFTRQQTLSPQILDMNEAVQELSAMLTMVVGARNTLQHDLGRDLWAVKADRTQIDRVLVNLSRNAKDAMPKGGTLTVRTRNVTERQSSKLAGPGMPVGEYVMIEVADTGTGMTPEVLAKLFQPFFTTKEVGKGTGLGLASVYGIIKQTGGYIYPESAVGEGTTFRIFLPRYIPSEAEEKARAEAAAAERAKRERPRDLTGTGRILLVEDEDFLRAVTARQLRRLGYEVLEAITGAEALEVMEAEDGKVDLVVSDVIMPEMDGPTMYREMLKTYPDTKVVFVSGYPSDAFDKGLEPNMSFTFVQKPYPGEVLAGKIKEAMVAA